jgi:hypothetical protein
MAGFAAFGGNALPRGVTLAAVPFKFSMVVKTL